MVTSPYRSLNPIRFAATTTTTFVELSRTLAGTSEIDTIALTPVPHGTWVEEGVGTMTVNSPTSVDLTATGAEGNSARTSCETVVGVQYTVGFTLAGQGATVSVGSTPDADDIVSGSVSVVGNGSVAFVATSTISYVKFQTTEPGSLLISNISISEAYWTTGGAGDVTNLTATSVTLSSPGGAVATFAIRSFPTMAGKTYTASYTSDLTVQRRVGSTPGASNIVASANTTGPTTLVFVATGTETHLYFQRLTVGIANITDLAISLQIWETGGPGTVTNQSETTVTIAGTGTGETFAQRVFSISMGEVMRLEFDTTADVVYTVTETDQ